MMHFASCLRPSAAPIDVVAAHLEIVSGARPRMRARCPAHGSRGGTLGVREEQDGKVLLRCHAGCKTEDVLHAAGLSWRDLYPDRASQGERHRERAAVRRRFDAAPRRTVHEEIDKAVDALRARLLGDNGYIRPLRASDYNDVRRLVCRMLEIDPLPAIAPFVWECPPHDADPAWPALYMRALKEQTRQRWHAIYPNASAWETDPDGPGPFDRMRAEQLARDWLRNL